MASPRVEPLHRVLFHEPELVDPAFDDTFLPSGDSAFVVMTSGLFQGRWFERGEIVICTEGRTRPGQAVVLVARSLGRPRLGVVRSTGFSGDRGEPCSPDRWMAAGHVRTVWRKALVPAGEQGAVDAGGAEGPAGWERVDVVLDQPVCATVDRAALTEVGTSARSLQQPPRGGVGRPLHTRPLQLSLFARAA